VGDGGSNAAARIQCSGVDLTFDCGLRKHPDAAADDESGDSSELHQVSTACTPFCHVTEARVRES
jgi:hypothetical protein